MNKSMRSKRKKKPTAMKSGGERSERKPSKQTAKKPSTPAASERAPKSKPKSNGITCREQQEPSKNEKKTSKGGSKEMWTGEETAKKMVASGFFNNNTISGTFKDLPTLKPPLDSCPCFKNNLQKVRAPDCPIPDDKLIKLTHAPDNFICASKVTVPEYNRTVILTQVPDVSNAQNIEDFWRMIFQENVASVVIAVMPLESSVTLQQIFPLLNGTYSNHGKMFLNNKKVESAVAVTSYTLEILPDGCSNSLFTTVYHLHNWRQKRGLEQVGDLVNTLEKVLKTNEVTFNVNLGLPDILFFQNTVFMSMNGTGRAGTMLALFTAMAQVQKGKEVNPKETMEKLRAERCGVVDNAEQYGTVHKAMAVWFKNKSNSEEIQKIA
ncbi:hypothetical protein CRE_25567 [Caenorhabditis remanei]|uniref:Tyrosine-protein phosphatase domain-containing protein n=1 Tax=Caenorhabditis remanei TaxID=31234 RepID=E3LSB5_CAERE|nr:hypothetical protein CRE_25567 [Caenorhabditis remanei]